MSTGNSIQVGDIVHYRPLWGAFAPVKVIVESMELTQFPREKYGDSVNEVSIGCVEQNRVVFGLDNGHWCYASQIVLPGGIKYI
jgi:hypothetical protein